MGTNESAVTNIDRFERTVVWKISRTLYLVLAGGASLGLLGSAILLAYTLTPTISSSVPSEPPQPAPPELTIDELRAAMTPSDSGGASDGVPRRTADTTDAGAPSAGQDLGPRIRGAYQSLSAFFTSDAPPWQSVRSTVCVLHSDWTGQCLRTETTVTEIGLGQSLDDVLLPLGSPERLAALELTVATLGRARMAGVTEERDLATAVRATLVGLRAGLDPSVLASAFDSLFAVPAASPDGSAPAGALPLEAHQILSALDAVRELRLEASDGGRLGVWMHELPGLLAVAPGDASETVAFLVLAWSAVPDVDRETALARVQKFVALMGEFPSGERMKAAEAYARAVAARAAAQDEAYLAAQQERLAEIARVEGEVVATREFKSDWRLNAAGALGVSLYAIATLGLFLALLAVERTTRLLRGLVDGSGR